MGRERSEEGGSGQPAGAGHYTFDGAIRNRTELELRRRAVPHLKCRSCNNGPEGNFLSLVHPGAAILLSDDRQRCGRATDGIRLLTGGKTQNHHLVVSSVAHRRQGDDREIHARRDGCLAG